MTEHISSTQAARRVLDAKLPERYNKPGVDQFWESVKPWLVPGVQILDVGAGRRPTVTNEFRPENSYYVGLDLLQTELDAAPANTYDRTVAADITQFISELQDRFDLVISCQVLEHVSSLDLAIENMRSYLHPGGRAILYFSGSFSIFGMINRLLPRKVGVQAMKYLLGRNPGSVYPAYYNHCYMSAIRTSLRSWSSFQVTPHYLGGRYFRFNRQLQALYMIYEDLCYRRNWQNLATHYLVEAIK